MKFFFNLPKKFDDYLVLFIKIGLVFILFSPFIMGDYFYFPLIVPRNLYWRLLVDIVFTLYVFLAIKNKDWRPKFNWGFILLIALVASLTISSLLGTSFQFSFWSNFVRMDGLVNWYYILLYVVVLLGVFKKKEDWLLWFNISVLVGWLVALYTFVQLLNFDWPFILPSDGGSRLTGPFGNASYLASFLFLQIILVFYLFLDNLIHKSGKLWQSIFYLLSSVLFIFILIKTQTRGDFFSLLLFIILLGLFYLWFERSKRGWLYYAVLFSGLAIVLFFGLVWQQKGESWVRKVGLLDKISRISLDVNITQQQSRSVDIAGQTRLLVWRNSLLGVKDKPIFGWGVENFSQVFNKYFPRKIYQEASSEIWLDRPHNVLVQYAVEGGSLALGLYLAIFIYLCVILYKKYKSEGQWLFYFFWLAFLISFLFHNLFTFDNINSNIFFYLILAFLFKLSPHHFSGPKKILGWKTNKFVLAIVCLLLSGVWLYQTVILPAQGNRLLLKTIQGVMGANQEADIISALGTWQKSFALSPSGDKDKVEVLSNLYREVWMSSKVSQATKNIFFEQTNKYLTQVVAEYPQDIMLSMYLSNFYNVASFDQPDLLKKNVSLLEKMHEQAPQRPDILVLQTNAYLKVNDSARARVAAEQMLALFPWTKEALWNMFLVDFQYNDLANMGKILDKIVIFNANLPINSRPQTNFTPAEQVRLQTYLDLAKISKRVEAVKLLEKYLNKTND